MAFNPDEYLAKVDPPKPKFDPDAYLATVDTNPPAPEQEGLLGTAQNLTQAGLMKLGEYTKPIMDPYEKYIAGPVRAGVKSVVDAPVLETMQPGSVGANFIKGAYNQFGKEGAPSGKDILNALPAGGLIPETPISEMIPGAFSDTGAGAKLQKGGALDVSPKGLVGGLIEAGLDPSSYIGAGGGAQAGKAAAATAKKVPGAIVKVESKIGKALTGIDDGVIKTYINQNKGVNDLIKKYGANTAEAADAIREQWQTQIRNFKSTSSQNIAKQLESHGPEVVNIKEALQKLNESKNKLNPATKKSAINEINEHIAVLQEMTDEAGDILLKDLHDAKEYFQEAAKSSYYKNGQIFMPGKDSARLAKDAARELRQKLNAAAPEIAKENNKLAMLHKSEEGVNKNLIKPGGPEGALMTAGAQPLSRQRKQLKGLEEASGVPMVARSEQLSAARAFANPDLLPIDATGKSATRLLGATGAGGLLAGPIGAAVGGVVTSPALLKLGLNTQEKVVQIAKKLGKPVEWVLDPKNAANIGQAVGLIGPAAARESQGLLK